MVFGALHGFIQSYGTGGMRQIRHPSLVRRIATGDTSLTLGVVDWRHADPIFNAPTRVSQFQFGDSQSDRLSAKRPTSIMGVDELLLPRVAVGQLMAFCSFWSPPRGK